MLSRIREIAADSLFYRGSVAETAELLPEDDDEVDDWIGIAVVERDSLLFMFLAVAMFHLKRDVSSRHVSLGVHLPGTDFWVGLVARRVAGDDVPERIYEALRDTPMSDPAKARLLLVAAEWCQEHRAGSYPPELLTEARLQARKGFKADKTATAYLLSTARILGDDRIITLLLQVDQGDPRRKAMVEEAWLFSRQTMEMYHRPIMELLPEKPPNTTKGFTVRRSVASIGRNEPCRCGSGKKYKRCCAEEDRKRLDQCSEVAGLTRAEVRANPEPYLTTARLMKSTPEEAARYDPLKIEPALLSDYFLVLCTYKLWEEINAGFEKAGWCEALDRIWWHALGEATRASRKETVGRLIEVRRRVTDPPFPTDMPVAVELLLARDEPHDFNKLLGQLSLEALQSNGWDATEEIAYGLLFSPIPALGILVARGLIPFCDKKKAVIILDDMLIAREKLNLCEDEPAGDLLDKRFAVEAVASGRKETPQLHAARQKLAAKAGEVRQMKRSLDQLRGEVERLENKAADAKEEKPSNEPAPTADPEILRGLREKVSRLKSVLKERHAERAILRRDLDRTLTDLESIREKHTKPGKGPQAQEDAEENLLMPSQLESHQPVRLVGFPKNFHPTLTRFPAQVGRGAMSLIGRLAAGEAAAFSGVVRLKASPETLRARVGIDYRLLFRLHTDTLEVVDLINRRDLEKRIKTLA